MTNPIEEYGYDPIKAAFEIDDEATPDGRSAFWDAISVVQRSGSEILIPMLRSSDPAVSSTALHMFAELSHKNRPPLIKDAMSGVHHPWASARFHTVDGMISNTNELSSSDLARLLSLVPDKDPIVRSKSAELIAVAPLEKLKDAISYISEFRDSHEQGLGIVSKPRGYLGAKNAIQGDDIIRKYYGYAAFLRAAKNGDLWFLPQDEDDSESSHFRATMTHMKIRADRR